MPYSLNPSSAQRLWNALRSSPASSPVNWPTARPSSAGGARVLPRPDGKRGGAARIVAAPERKPGRLARRRYDQYTVMGDLGDSPTGSTQRDDITGPRFVDHFLVEFAYSGGGFGVGSQVDGE